MKELKKYIETTFSEIKFNNKNHTYNRNNIEYISTSKFISNFYKKFDSTKIGSYVAKRDNRTLNDVLEEWEDKKNISLIKGNKTHDFAEKYFYNKTLIPETKEEHAVIKFYNLLNADKYEPLFAERILFSDKYMLAGTADLLLYDKYDKSIVIADWKTNKDLFKSYNNLLEPFKFLKDSNLNKYKLQLSTYNLMLEEYGVKVSNRIIVWLRPDGEFVSINAESYTNNIKNYLTL